MNFLKSKKFWIILTVVVVIIIIVIVIAKRRKAKTLELLNTGSSNSSTGSNSVGSTTNTSTPRITLSRSKFPLGINSEGQEVLDLQKYLNYYMSVKYPSSGTIRENGYFGTDTAYALKKLWNADTVTQSDYLRSIKPFINNAK